TGRPARTPWRDVTVAAQDCVAADIAAKAALLLGRAGPSWLDRRGLAGRFVDHHGAVQLTQTWQQCAPDRLAARWCRPAGASRPPPDRARHPAPLAPGALA